MGQSSHKHNKAFVFFIKILSNIIVLDKMPKAKGKIMKSEKFGLIDNGKEIEPKAEEKPFFEPQLTQSIFGGDMIVANTPKEIKNKFPLPNGFVGGIICGSSGEGKSYLMLSLISQFNKLSYVIVLTKIHGNPVYTALEGYCQSKGITYAFADNPKDGAAAIEQAINDKPEGTYSLTIFDDFNNGSSHSRDDKYNKLSIMTYQLLRNYQNHTLYITQSYVGVNTLVRNNMSFCVLFRMKSTPAIDRAMIDVSNMTDYSPDEVRDIYNRVLKEKHAYMLTREGKVYIYLPSNGERLIEIN